MINFNELPNDIKKLIFTQNRNTVLQKKYKEIFSDEVLDELTYLSVTDSQVIQNNLDYEKEFDEEKYNMWINDGECTMGFRAFNFQSNFITVNYYRVASKILHQIREQKNLWEQWGD
tara:strand:- start:645 stop:995 length:351 start_codon:yes stop_codon:yes gene_type:complete